MRGTTGLTPNRSAATEVIRKRAYYQARYDPIVLAQPHGAPDIDAQEMAEVARAH
jgi:hypothetical protein